MDEWGVSSAGSSRYRALKTAPRHPRQPPDQSPPHRGRNIITPGRPTHRENFARGNRRVVVGGTLSAREGSREGSREDSAASGGEGLSPYINKYI